MKFLFFDTETNGLPIDYKASYTDVDNWPRVISLAWTLRDEAGLIIRQASHLIKPDGWTIPTDKFWIDNGYSQAQNEAEGIDIAMALDEFKEAKMEADFLVAHNLNFDHRIVWAEFIRAGKEPKTGMTKICTMQKSTNVCQLPSPSGRGYKWPKLEELYHFLFNKEMNDAHNALADVTACAECFFELVNRGIIVPQIAA